MYSLTIILNLHREGTLAERTITNLQDIIQESAKRYKTWSKVEIVCILDNSDELTKNIVNKYSGLFNKIEYVNFKDLANSRNHGVSIASNNFVLFADGDDYASLNILKSTYDIFYEHYNKIKNIEKNIFLLQNKDHIAVFPKYLVEFPKLLQVNYEDSNEFISQNIKFEHCYNSRIIIYKNLLKRYKVQANSNPYGYEDWDLNNRLLSNGVKFKLSPYVLYYRKDNNKSMLSLQIKNKQIVRNSLIYNFEMSKYILKDNLNTEKSIEKKGIIWKILAKQSILRKIYKSEKHILKRIYNMTNNTSFRIYTWTTSRIKKIVSSAKQDIFVEYKLFLESYGENISYRAGKMFYSYKHLSMEPSNEFIAYSKLLNFLENKEVLYIFPWIITGGADKVSVEYTKALLTKNACVITTTRSGNRIDKLEVEHLDLGTELYEWFNFSNDNKLHILIKAIINSKVKLVHVVNSDIGLQSIKYYGKVYREYNIKTIITLFCPSYDLINKKYYGAPIEYPEIFFNADLVISDNNYWYHFFKKLNQNKDFNFKKIASSCNQRNIIYKQKNIDTNKILWASRVCDQKLFYILEKIVNMLPEYVFVIYGASKVEQANQAILNRLIKKNNVEFYGEYQDILEIDLNKFDLYLFTSMFEGIPTIILDMIMGGIPIVSADVGGISEVLGEDYPLLVTNIFEADEYIKKIKEFYNNKEAIVSDIESIRNLVIDIYNEKIFHKEYKSMVEGLLDDSR